MPQRPPFWFTALLVLLIIPAGGLPALLSRCPADLGVIKAMIWCYPFYLLLSGWLAWKSYWPRPVVAWILVAFMVMTTAAMYCLAVEF